MSPPAKNMAGIRGRSGSDLDSMPDAELLEVRICDLGVRIAGTWLEEMIGQLYGELEQRGQTFRPHFWLGEEWFSPDGVPGVAIPFYLSHPRLARLERKLMLDVEGGSRSQCMKILRHEAGHCFDTAFRLHRRRKWQQVFGKSSQEYPEYYQPRPYSKSYVLHLDLWYAQSHPAEDFAETFAVWLKPRSGWKTQYLGWPAVRKLEYVEQLMEEVASEKPAVTSRKHVEPLSTVQKTLREHYDEKCARYLVDVPAFYDRDLTRLFSNKAEFSRREPAARFLNRHRRPFRKSVAEWTGQYQYLIDQVLREMIVRCRELDLRLCRPERETRWDTLVMLTVQTMNYLHAGHHRLAL